MLLFWPAVTAWIDVRESLPKCPRLWLPACSQPPRERLLVLARLRQMEHRLQVQVLLESPELLLVQIQLPELLILLALVRQLGGSTDPNALCRTVGHPLTLQTFPS